MRKLCRQFVLTIAVALAANGASAQSAALPEPVMWRQDTFLIPYQFSAASDPKSAREVVLYLSKDWGRTWREVTRARPDVRCFTYRAEGDGDYCFAMRTIDQAGQSWPAGEQVTELRVIVDTRAPVFQSLQGALDPQGQVQLQWRVGDEHIDPASLKLEIQVEGQTAWQSVPVGNSTSVSTSEFTGQTTCIAPAGARRILVRATIHDAAGNRGTIGAEVQPGATLPSTPTTAIPISHGAWQSGISSSVSSVSSPQELANPFATQTPSTIATTDIPPTSAVAARAPADQSWPADAHSLMPFAASEKNVAPRVARLDTLQGVPPQPTPPTQWPQSPFHQASSSRGNGVTPLRSTTAPPSPAIPPDARIINASNFALDYDVSDVGQWGVAKVELWGTADGGQTWRSFAIDHDNVSPVNVTAPGEGLYGFRIAIEAVGGLAPQPPAPRDRPELWVHVDTTLPQAQLVAARQGEGYFADHLEITWRADDPNLAERPIGIFYSSRPNGPWSAAATSLENSGRYSWRLQRHVPSQIFLRIEARDRAGNVGVHQLDQPIALSVPQATGSLRDLHRP